MHADTAVSDASLLEPLRQAEGRLATVSRAELAQILAPLVERLHERLPAGAAATVPNAALAFCHRLYSHARSGDALPLGRAVLAQAALSGNVTLERQAAGACGLLSADTADLVGAIEHHVQALRLCGQDHIKASGVWNNIGIAMGIAGNYEMAARCYQRSIQLSEPEREPVYNRYLAYVNLSYALLQVEMIEEGLRYGHMALREQTQAFRERDLLNALLLERNLVRLLVAAQRTAEAEPHVSQANALAEQIRTPRALVAATTTRAVFELADGRTDVALTRFEQAVTGAREVPATLRDTLACAVAAEELAGNSERALLRLGELSEHVYRSAVERARAHVELASIEGRSRTALDHAQEQARARLISKLAPPAQPDAWNALERLAVTAVMRMDKTGFHGKRVGALSKALAMASGIDPLQSLEIGFAAEIHDIGMLSVPEEILAKKGPLSDGERAAVQRHIDAGADILRDDRHPRIFLAREIARYHHARWDGAGYPERVGGKFIPIAARICAVADAYDEMVFGLCGHPRLTMDQALAELHRNAGSQFDPELVTYFDGMIRTESEDLGMDLGSDAGMESFQELVNALQQDRGYV
jgi:HD-GYP domain-containing protein (c-di-GMP phosphodiesterase class II)